MAVSRHMRKGLLIRHYRGRWGGPVTSAMDYRSSGKESDRKMFC